MKRRVKRMAPDADRCRTGLEQIAQQRRLKWITSCSDSAYIAKRFKEKKGPVKRFFPAPWRPGRVVRAAKFLASCPSGQGPGSKPEDVGSIPTEATTMREDTMHG